MGKKLSREERLADAMRAMLNALFAARVLHVLETRTVMVAIQLPEPCHRQISDAYTQCREALLGESHGRSKTAIESRGPNDEGSRVPRKRRPGRPFRV